MSVRHGLLALLERGPMYGYQLRAAFEESAGGSWPLNIGQVYTTLGRLERDRLVRSLPTGEGGQRPYELTDAGRAEVADWFAAPVGRDPAPRDELAIKLALAMATPGVDPLAVIRTQRAATTGTMREYTRRKLDPPRGADPRWQLIMDAMIFRAEAEVRWLDHCEAVLSAAPATTPGDHGAGDHGAGRPRPRR